MQGQGRDYFGEMARSTSSKQGELAVDFLAGVLADSSIKTSEQGGEAIFSRFPDWINKITADMEQDNHSDSLDVVAARCLTLSTISLHARNGFACYSRKLEDVPPESPQRQIYEDEVSIWKFAYESTQVALQIPEQGRDTADWVSTLLTLQRNYQIGGERNSGISGGESVSSLTSEIDTELKNAILVKEYIGDFFVDYFSNDSGSRDEGKGGPRTRASRLLKLFKYSKQKKNYLLAQQGEESGLSEKIESISLDMLLQYADDQINRLVEAIDDGNKGSQADIYKKIEKWHDMQYVVRAAMEIEEDEQLS